MPLERSVSYPLSTDRAPARAATVPLARLALGLWAALVYLVYWLGYLSGR